MTTADRGRALRSMGRVLPVLCALLIAALPARAGDAGVAAGTVDITRFEVDGNTVLKRSTIDAVLRRFTGRARTAQDIGQAVQALEAAYHRRGYVFATVAPGAAEPRGGVVHLVVTQPRIGRVRIQGNAHHSDANIRRSLPHFAEGEVPNTTDLAVDVRVANENPSKKVTPQLQAGEDNASIDASLQVADEKTWSTGAILDNSGVDLPGRTHVTAQFENFNVGGIDHLLSLQYTTSTEHPSDLKVFGAGYHIPLYAHGDSVDLYASYSDINAGSISAGLVDLTVSGAGAVFGAHYTHDLPQLGIYDSQLVAGLDRKAFRNVMNAADPRLVGDVTVDPLSLSYLGHWVRPTFIANVYLTAVRNLPGGSQGSDLDFAVARIGARPDYGLLRYGGGLTGTLPREWSVRLAVNGQVTRDELVPGEQFGVGGAASVRGLQERDLTDDSGVVASGELYTPDLCLARHDGLTHCNVLAFVDDGHASNNDPLPGQDRHDAVTSAGIGLRLAHGKALSLQMDYGQVVHTTDPALKGARRLHAMIALTF